MDVAAGRTAILKGDYARHVEDYLRRKAYDDAEDYLRRWENAFPADKLEGYWSLLRVELLLARRRWGEAVREVEILCRVNPASNYAAEMLMLAADACLKTGDRDKGKDLLKRIVEKYPESPLAAKAAEKLKKK